MWTLTKTKCLVPFSPNSENEMTFWMWQTCTSVMTSKRLKCHRVLTCPGCLISSFQIGLVPDWRVSSSMELELCDNKSGETANSKDMLGTCTTVSVTVSVSVFLYLGLRIKQIKTTTTTWGKPEILKMIKFENKLRKCLKEGVNWQRIGRSH